MMAPCAPSFSAPSSAAARRRGCTESCTLLWPPAAARPGASWRFDAHRRAQHIQGYRPGHISGAAVEVSRHPGLRYGKTPVQKRGAPSATHHAAVRTRELGHYTRRARPLQDALQRRYSSCTARQRLVRRAVTAPAMLGAPLGTWLRQGPALLRTRRVSTSGAAPDTSAAACGTAVRLCIGRRLATHPLAVCLTRVPAQAWLRLRAGAAWAA